MKAVFALAIIFMVQESILAASQYVNTTNRAQPYSKWHQNAGSQFICELCMVLGILSMCQNCTSVCRSFFLAHYNLHDIIMLTLVAAMKNVPEFHTHLGCICRMHWWCQTCSDVVFGYIWIISLYVNIHPVTYIITTT